MNYSEENYEDAGQGIGEVGGLLDDLVGLLPSGLPFGIPMPGAAPIPLPLPPIPGPSDGGGNPFSGLLGGGSAPSSSEQSATITAPSGLNVRAQPNENAARVGGVGRGAVVTVLKTGLPATPAAPKGWTQIRTADGTEGYVTSEWLSFGPAQAPKAAPSPSPSPSPAPSPSKLVANAGGLDTKKIAIVGGVLAAVAVGVALFAGKGKKKP